MQFLSLLALLPLIAASPFLSSSSPLNPRIGSDDTCDICDPSPPNNLCDITTSCTPIGAKTYCACRAGYRATMETTPDDTHIQWRLPVAGQEGRVFVQPGVPCNTWCDHWELGAQGCAEVGLRTDCA